MTNAFSIKLPAIDVVTNGGIIVLAGRSKDRREKVDELKLSLTDAKVSFERLELNDWLKGGHNASVIFIKRFTRPGLKARAYDWMLSQIREAVDMLKTDGHSVTVVLECDSVIKDRVDTKHMLLVDLEKTDAAYPIGKLGVRDRSGPDSGGVNGGGA